MPKPRPGEGYVTPPLELLKLGGGESHSRRALEDTARELEETLRQHGVDARLTKIVPGPTVTRYEIELAPGVKVSRVTGLSHDIAYALATPDVRLLAPIPGKSAIGVEVPNRRRRLVTLGDVLRSPEAEVAHHPLEIGLGMDISGRPKLLNLSELPHVLIAGATGAGKSSCINSLVTSLLMRTTPDDVRLMMVDPKRVELNQYNGVPHLLTKVINNPKKAAEALQWAVAEMDRRYDLLSDAHVRDIIGYREKHDGGTLDPDGFDRFPYIVIIVDELNDLMMVAGRDVEEAIVRIAQMARAVGIHLVIATQRPSVDVITGVIKANIPSRLAFSVASQTDSRVIIDGMGAEKLVGMGDMLVITATDPRPQRIQGAWVTEEEVHTIVGWAKKQREAKYEDHVIEAAAQQAKQTAEADEGDDAELVRTAMELVVRSQLGSTSMLQRKLRIGFARAGRVMDILERKGVVGPSEGSKARAVLMTEEDLEQMYADSTVES
jgi:S-DNA-T family DNA segregation ATPase FtsK/SpoIIIE